MSFIKRFAQLYQNNKNRNYTITELSYSASDYFALLPAVIFIILPVFVFAYLEMIGSWKTLTTFPVLATVFQYFSVFFGTISILMYFCNSHKQPLRQVFLDNIPMVFFLALCLWMIVSTAVNSFDTDAVKGEEYRNESIFTFLVYFLIYYFCSSTVSKEKLKRFASVTLLACSWAAGVLSLVHKYVFPLVALSESNDDGIIFTYHQINHYGYFLTVAASLSAALLVFDKGIKRKVFYLLTFCFNSFLLTLNGTFGCFIAVCAALVFLTIVSAVIRRKSVLAALMFLSLFLAVSFVAGRFFNSFFSDLAVLFEDIKLIVAGNGGEHTADSAVQTSVRATKNAGDAGTGRWSLWKATVGYIKEKPLFGSGIEGIGLRLKAETGYSDRPHNEYLQYAAFFGIPAALLYVSGVFSVYLKALRRRANLDGVTAACLVACFGYLVSAFFGNTMYYTAPLLFIFLGMASAVPGQKENKNA